MAKKRKAAGIKRASRRRAARRRRATSDTTVNAVVILVVIVIVLGGLYLYAQNKKQAVLLQGLSPMIAAVVAPLKAVLAPQAVAVVPIGQSAIRTPEPAVGGDERPPIALTEAK